MKEIDFIPDWYRANRRRRRDLAVRATCLAVLAVAMIAASAGRYAQTAAAREDLAQLQASFESQEDVIHGLSVLELRLAELGASRQLVSDVAGGAPMHGVLAELSHLMPDATTLTELRVAQGRRIADARPAAHEDPDSAAPAPDDRDGTLEITGWAVSDINVGSLMSNMARSPLLHDVRLRYSKPAVVNGRQAREFRLTCRLPQFE